MKEITILSGKGGAGKTSVAAAIASLAENAVFCDNDVDAADLHLILCPEIKEEHDFGSGSKAVIDQEKCTVCGLCIDHCRFDAIHPNDEGIPVVNPFQCEGCRLCERICPVDAIQTIQYRNNKWFVSDTRFGPLVHARMGAGEDNSGLLVTEIREKAREIAIQTAADFIINDGPPGIGCPVIASVTGTGVVLLVTEPSLSGLHDAKRLMKLVDSFKIPALAVINKYDINLEITGRIEKFLEEKTIPLIGKIPFDKRLVDAMVAGKSIVEFDPQSELTVEFKTIWESIIKN
jgi:MinD superfamily P-loop ATPase